MSVSVSQVNMVKFNTAGNDGSFIKKESQDFLAVEEPLEIRLIYGNEKTPMNISVTMRTPGHDEDLAAGFLFTEGIIHSFSEITRIFNDGINDQSITVELDPGVKFDPSKIQRHFYTSSSCGVCGKSSIEAVHTVSIYNTTGKNNFIVDAAKLTELPGILLKRQEMFRHTGGLHASALFDAEYNLVDVREDVGRHNALDKLIGSCLKSGLMPLDNHILLLSGRASFELIQKAAMAGFRVVCAVGAPSSLAVDLATKFGITLAGFLRDGRFNVYSRAEQVKN